jgi:hypothetical protein
MSWEGNSPLSSPVLGVTTLLDNFRPNPLRHPVFKFFTASLRLCAINSPNSQPPARPRSPTLFLRRIPASLSSSWPPVQRTSLYIRRDSHKLTFPDAGLAASVGEGWPRDVSLNRQRTRDPCHETSAGESRPVHTRIPPPARMLTAGTPLYRQSTRVHPPRKRGDVGRFDRRKEQAREMLTAGPPLYRQSTRVHPPGKAAREKGSSPISDRESLHAPKRNKKSSG